MSGKVWMSDVLRPSGLGDKQGTRTKFYGHEWNPSTFKIPVEPDEVYAAYRRHRQGYALQRSDFPEAEAVFDERRFSRLRDLFFAGPFFAAKGKLAELLSRFDLGQGGLIPFMIYEADLVTPVEGEFFLLNFGARKNTILPEQCEDARKFVIDPGSGQQIWTINDLKPDGAVVLSPAALEGADLWFEQAVYNKIFVSEALAQGLIDIGMGSIFKLTECWIEEGAR